MSECVSECVRVFVRVFVRVCCSADSGLTATGSQRGGRVRSLACLLTRSLARSLCVWVCGCVGGTWAACFVGRGTVNCARVGVGVGVRVGGSRLDVSVRLDEKQRLAHYYCAHGER